MKNLSKRAKKILSEIEKRRNSLKRNRSDKPKKHISGIKNFNSRVYLNLTSSNKLPIWLIISIALFLIIIIIFLRIYNLSKIEKELISEFQPKLPILKTNITQIEKDIKSSQSTLDQTFKLIEKSQSRFRDRNKIKLLIDDISRLFEVSNMTIVNQNIKFAELPFSKEENLPSSTLPEEDRTFFDIEKDNKDNKNNLKKSSSNDNNQSTIKKEQINKNIVVAATKTISLDMKGDVPGEISFLNIEYTLRGSYLDYLQVRKTITRIIPSATLPIEDIVVRNGRTQEFKVLIEVPYTN